MRKLLVGGNWKQNGTLKFATDFPSQTLKKITFNTQKVEVVVAPTTLHLLTVRSALSGTNI